jgi:hypothetical protein
MADVRKPDDLPRMLKSLLEDVRLLKRGVPAPITVPAAFPGGVHEHPRIVGSTFVVAGAQAAERPIWTLDVPALAATTTAAVRIEVPSGATWTARLAVTQFNPAQSAGTASGLAGTQTGTQTGNLVYANNGTTPITSGLLVLYFRLVTGTEARVITTALTG